MKKSVKFFLAIAFCTITTMHTISVEAANHKGGRGSVKKDASVVSIHKESRMLLTQFHTIKKFRRSKSH